MPDAPPPIPHREFQGLLSYRAVRYLPFIGIAPKWMDRLLILATAVVLFFGMGATLIVFLAESPEAKLIAGLVAVIGWAATFALFWWSNNFRHKRPVSVNDPIPGPIEGPMRVMPVAPPMPVIPVSVIPANEGDPVPPQSSPDRAPPAPADPAT